MSYWNLDLKPCLNLPCQRAEIRDALQFVIWELNVEVIFQPREQVERLQAVDAQRLEEVIIGSELRPRHFEVCRCKVQNFVKCLIGSSHIDNFSLTSTANKVARPCSPQTF